MMDSLHQSNEELGYGQMCHAVREVNNEVRQERKSVSQYEGIHTLKEGGYDSIAATI